MVLRDPEWTPGCHRDAAVIYLETRPEDEIEAPSGSEMGIVHDPLCPRCETGRLTLEPDTHGYGDMYVCRAGCGQRFFTEVD